MSSEQWRIFCLLEKLDNIATLCQHAMGNDELRNPAFLDILKVIREPIIAKHADEYPLTKLITDPKPGEDI